MGEEFYSSIKLTTGEEIFSLVCIDENDGDPVLVLQNPVVMKVITTGGSYGIKIKPWMSIPGDDFFIIKLDKIITMTEVKDESMIEFYNSYLEEDSTDDISDPSSHQTKITNKMGYVSTVEEAREMLENLYRLKDNKES